MARKWGNFEPSLSCVGAKVFNPDPGTCLAISTLQFVASAILMRYIFYATRWQAYTVHTTNMERHIEKALKHANKTRPNLSELARNLSSRTTTFGNTLGADGARQTAQAAIGYPTLSRSKI